MQSDESIKCFNKNEECYNTMLEMTVVGLNPADKNDDDNEPEIQCVTTQNEKKFVNWTLATFFARRSKNSCLQELEIC